LLGVVHQPLEGSLVQRFELMDQSAFRARHPAQRLGSQLQALFGVRQHHFIFVRDFGDFDERFVQSLTLPDAFMYVDGVVLGTDVEFDFHV